MLTDLSRGCSWLAIGTCRDTERKQHLFLKTSNEVAMKDHRK